MNKIKSIVYSLRNWRTILTASLMLFSTNAIYAQSNSVSGVVIDELGETVIGATVIEKGSSSNGTITDVDGKFSLNVSDTKNAILKVSYVGYQTTEVKVDGKKDIRIHLTSASVNLNEFIAIGYGSVKKKDLTGAVSSVKAEELLRGNPASINQALQGKIAGVNVSQTDGAPGAGITIQIRGINAFGSASAQPLYVIDGVPFNAGEGPSTDYGMKQGNNPLSLINPQDIESIDVLKDASATAIYGSRGAAGVILITTKGGQSGKSKVDFSANFGVSKVIKKLDLLDAATYGEYRNEAQRNNYIYAGKDYVEEWNSEFPIEYGRWEYQTAIDPLTGLTTITKKEYIPSIQDFRNGYMNGGTDWQDQIFDTAITQDYNLSVSGGDEKGSYMFSLGMLDQEGVIINSSFKRYNFRSSITRKVRSWLELGNTLFMTKADNRFARTSTENYGILDSAISYIPTYEIMNPEEPSGVTEDRVNGLSNPYLYARTAKNHLESYIINNSAFAIVSFTKDLKFRQNIGYSYSFNKRNQYYDRYTGPGLNARGYGSQADNFYENFTSESTLSYAKDFAEIHHIDAVVGWTAEKATWGGKTMSRSDFAFDVNQENDMSAGLKLEANTSNKGKSTMMSYLGRVNYILMDKYYLTASVRRDGSSRLANNRWSTFPSIALAWRASEESFIKNMDFFDNIKVRFGYGMTGNQSINPYSTKSQLVAQNYPYDGSWSSGYADSRWAGATNTVLVWETTKQYNIGLDVGFLDNRINFTIDAYHKNTKDLLQQTRQIPWDTGFGNSPSNFGNVINKGLEVGGNFYLIENRDFSWKMDANISFNKNEIRNIEGDQFGNILYGMEEVFLRRHGVAIGTMYTYVADGFYDNEAEVRADPVNTGLTEAGIRRLIGEVKYKDLNGDGKIDKDDKAITGDTNPDFTYGMTNTFTYKNFTFSFFFQGIQGNDIFNANLGKYTMDGTGNMPRFVWENRWTPTNKEGAQFPRANLSYDRDNKRTTQRYIEDGSYLRLKNLSFSYRLFQPVKEVESVNFTFSVNNLFTISDYRWYDPDVNAFGSDPTRRGVDMSSYPSARTFNFGVQVSF